MVAIVLDVGILILGFNFLLGLMAQLLIEDYKLEIVNWIKDGSVVNLFAKWLIAEL